MSEPAPTMLDADAEVARAAFAASGLPPLESLSPMAARALMAELRARAAVAPLPLADVEDVNGTRPDGSPLPLRVYRAAIGGRAAPCLLFFHGGGWVLNDLDTHDALCRAICHETAATVLSVGYRLAPEHPYPAAIDDAVAALRFAVTQATPLNIDPARIAVGGDSSGGNLAAVLTLMARDGTVPPVRAQSLLYPALDLTLSLPSHALAGAGIAVRGSTMRWFRDLYLGAADATQWRASPLKAASLAGLAPCLLVTAGVDPLQDEGLAYAGRLAQEGNRMTHLHFPGQLHGFLSAATTTPTARRAMAAIGTFLRAELAA